MANLQNLTEQWRPIDGFEDFYEVSDLGFVRTVPQYSSFSNNQKRELASRLLKPGLANGYFLVGLRINGKTHTRPVHRLVAQAFIPNPDNLPEVNHKFGDKTDNRASELEWCTESYNTLHSYDAGLRKKAASDSPDEKRGIIKTFAKRLKSIRNERKISLRSLAGAACMEHSQISRIERGLVNPTYTTILSLAEALGIDPGDLFPR